MRKMKTHTKVILSVFSALLVLLILASAVLWSVLSAYEATRSKYVAEEVFERYFANYDFAGFLKAADPDYRPLETDENINSIIKNYYEGRKLGFLRLDSEDDTEEKYAVIADSRQIAYFILKQSGKTARYGFKYYELSGGEVQFPQYKKVTALVPAGYTLRLNGNTVDRSFVTESGIRHKSCDYVLEPAMGITYEKYSVMGIFEETALTAFSADGSEVAVDFDMAEGIYKASVKYDDVLMSQYKDRCLSAARAYAKYMTNDGTLEELAEYLDKNKPIYKKIKGVDLNWIPVHTGHKITNEQASEFYRYSDEVFSCRVNLTVTLSRPDYSDHKENIDVIFYLHRSGDQYLIYDIVTNS